MDEDKVKALAEDVNRLLVVHQEKDRLVDELLSLCMPHVRHSRQANAAPLYKLLKDYFATKKEQK